MASVRTEIVIEAPAADAWSALRDWGNPHRRLVPGFVVDARLDGADRIVTFFNGVTVREVLVDLDDDARRLVWSVVDGPYTHHNGAAQIFDEGENRTRFVWTADLLPAEAAERTRELMEQGTRVVGKTLEGAARAR